MMKGREKGFTLVDLVIATAITGLIVSFLGTSIYQMLTVTDYGSGKLLANHELQNASFWFQIDGQKAKAATGGNNLVLTLADNSTVTYALDNTRLERAAGTGDMVLAKNITDVEFTVDNRVITMSLTSSPESRDNISENGIYKVYLRPNEDS